MLSAVGAEASPDTTRTVGTAVHAVAQQVAEGLPPADAPAVLAAELDQLDLGPGWSDQRQRQSAQEMLARFLDWHAAAGRELVGVEIEFDAIVGRALIRGKVDRLERDAEGRLVVVDLKTGKTPAKNTEEHGQLAAYQVAVAAGGFGEHGSVPGRRGAAAGRHGAKAKEQHQEPLPADVPLAETWAGELLAEVGEGMGGGDLRGAHRLALLAVPGPPQLPAAGARPAGDRMSRAPGRRPAVLRRPPRRRRRRARRAPAAARPRRGRRPLRAVLRAVAGAGARRRRPAGPAAGRRRRCRLGQDRDDGRPRRRGSWPTGSWSPRRSSASPSPARRPASSTSASGCGSARSPGTPRPTTDLRERLDIAQPTVSTYHGYAAALVAEHGLRIGVEPGAGVLGPAMCWGQAATVVTAWTGDMSDVPLTLLTTVEDVLALAAELGEHDISPAALRAWTARLEAQIAGYADAPRKKGPYAPVIEMLARQQARVALLPLVEAFEARKRAAGAIDYADQVAYAARIAVASAEVGRRERARWKVVLLDEYQDTSVGQLRMLEALFGRDTGHPVLAVGDPRQSIYGWRGASAGTIERFDRTFPGAARTGPPSGSRWPPAGATTTPSSPSPTRCRAMLPPPDAAAARPRAGAHRRPGRGERRALRHGRRGDRGAAPTGSRRAGRHRRARPGRPAADRGGAGPGPQAAARHRRRAARARPARGGRRARRAARGARGVRRRRDPDRARRPDRRRRARPAAHRCALADRPARPRRPRGPRPRARALAPSCPGRGGPTSPSRRPTERGSIVEALDDLGGPDAYSAAGYRRLRRLGARARPPAHAG